ncbi:MAG: hypothetical protein FWC24_03490 [Treponema sp.]|nr:hypothetical protein [Treponema sp.]
MSNNKLTLSSPSVIFSAYVIIAALCILFFRLIFPGEVAPLSIFSRNWRLIRGLLDIIGLFPALVFSALVIAIGVTSTENNLAGFPDHLFQRLKSPLIIAICAASLYAMLFFLILPLAQNYEKNLRFQGEIYHLAKERAEAHGQAGDWLEVTQFIGICDSVWMSSPEVAELRAEAGIHLEELRLDASRRIPGTDPARNLNSASVSALPGQGHPVDASEAITLGEAALSEGRLFDAHWLASLARRIAQAGGVDSTRAAQLAARAWNQIESQHPSSSEINAFSNYELKLSGYEAMVSGDWIRAYYIFKELLSLTPNDPDAVHFFAACERGTKESAFFIDELKVSLGETLTGTVFSLPGDYYKGQERLVLRIASLSSASDFAYGTGIEYMVFDTNARPLLSLSAPYAKILPITLDGQPQVLVMMRALDRHDRDKRWEPEWNARNDTVYYPETAQITLNVSYETFLMLSEMRQGLPSMQINALHDASGIAGDMGYIPEVFEAEILNRLGACLFFLPMAVIAIVIGWNHRAKFNPRYLIVLMLPILPIAFTALTYLYRTVFNIIGISLILNFGFSFALTVLIITLALSYLLSLILLAAQRN